MCGRFTLRASAREIATLFDLDEVPGLQPRYNIAPSQPVAAVRIDPSQGKRTIAMLRWGLIPRWAKDPKIAFRTINARAETVASKPAFREAFRKRRCLIPADGFYEWRHQKGVKQPFFVQQKEGRPFALAGLWEQWQRDGEQIQSCTIVVTQANAVLRTVHDRMPVIVSPADYASWLDPTSHDETLLASLVAACANVDLEIRPVSTLVNNPRNDLPACVEVLA